VEDSPREAVANYCNPSSLRLSHLSITASGRDLEDERSPSRRSQRRTAIFDYVEAFYNRERTQAALDYLSPADYEAAQVVA
jgi:transposase InsO family protein